MKRAALMLFCTLSMGAAASEAQAWDPFRSPNRHVERGNRHMAEDEPGPALEAYDRAAEELPSEPRVALNRGLALLAKDELGQARQAFLRAAEPPAEASIQADAYYNLGLAFYREGDEVAGEQEHEQAQKLFREAADAFKRSLRAEPGNREAGWNLELALRRIREQKERQQAKEEQEQKDKDEQEQDKEQEQNDEDQQNQKGEQDREQGDEQDEQQQDQPPQKGDQQNEQEQKSERQSQEQRQEQEDQQDGASERERKREEQERREQQARTERGDEERELPPKAERILDALQSSEENLWRHRAHRRGTRVRREPEKDW